MALPTLVTQITPLVGGLLLAALWAADISTAVGLLLGCSTLVTEDFLKRLVPGMVSPKREVLISRLAVLLVSAATLWLALTSVGILKTVTTALAMTSSFTLLILANIYVPSLCRKATGFWTILASVLVWLAWTWLPAVRIVPHVIYLEWPVCLVVFALCAVLSREPAERLIKATAELGS
jgi:SSS family solute:Na+ symporter